MLVIRDCGQRILYIFKTRTVNGQWQCKKVLVEKPSIFIKESEFRLVLAFIFGVYTYSWFCLNSNFLLSFTFERKRARTPIYNVQYQ